MENITGVYKKGGERLFTKAFVDRIRENGFELKEGGFRFEIRKTIFL